MTDTPRKTLSLKRPITTTPPTPTEQPESNPARNTRLNNKRIIRREELPVSKSVKSYPPKPEPASAKRKNDRASRPRDQIQKPLVEPPSKVEASTLNQALTAEFAVWSDYQPLALGIEDEILGFAQMQGLPYSKRVIQKLLRMHCRHGKYLQSVLAGQQRFNLKGEAACTISEEEKHHAQRTLAARPSRSEVKAD